MDSVSVLLIIGLLLWGALGTLVGFQTLKRQREAAEQNHRRTYLANVGNARLQQAQFFRDQNGPLVNRTDVDIAIFAQVLHQLVAVLNEIGNEAAILSEAPQEYSLENIQNLFAAYNILNGFLEHSLTVWNKKFDYEKEDSDEVIGKQKARTKDPSREAADEMEAAGMKIAAARQRLAAAP